MSWWNVAGYTEETCQAAGGTWDPQGFCTHLGYDADFIVPEVPEVLPTNTSWEQDERTELKTAIASTQVTRISRMLDGSVPTEADMGENEYRRARGIVHHRPERAAALDTYRVFGEG